MSASITDRDATLMANIIAADIAAGPTVDPGNGRLPADVTVTLVVKPPTSETPGYLRRQRRALSLTRNFRSLMAEMKAGPGDPALLDRLEAANTQIADFLLDYVVEPADRGLATEAILDLSETRLMDVIAQVQAGAGSRPLAPTSEPTSASASNAG